LGVVFSGPDESSFKKIKDERKVDVDKKILKKFHMDIHRFIAILISRRRS
jgi:hypothetical protein